MVELGFMTQEEYNEACAELIGEMYGNVNAASGLAITQQIKKG